MNCTCWELRQVAKCYNLYSPDKETKTWFGSNCSSKLCFETAAEERIDLDVPPTVNFVLANSEPKVLLDMEDILCHNCLSLHFSGLSSSLLFPCHILLLQISPWTQITGQEKKFKKKEKKSKHGSSLACTEILRWSPGFLGHGSQPWKFTDFSEEPTSGREPPAGSCLMLQQKPNLAPTHAAVVTGTGDKGGQMARPARDPALARCWQMDTKAANTIKAQRGVIFGLTRRTWFNPWVNQLSRGLISLPIIY